MALPRGDGPIHLGPGGRRADHLEDHAGILGGHLLGAGEDVPGLAHPDVLDRAPAGMIQAGARATCPARPCTQNSGSRLPGRPGRRRNASTPPPTARPILPPAARVQELPLRPGGPRGLVRIRAMRRSGQPSAPRTRRMARASGTPAPFRGGHHRLRRQARRAAERGRIFEPHSSASSRLAISLSTISASVSTAAKASSGEDRPNTGLGDQGHRTCTPPVGVSTQSRSMPGILSRPLR